MNRETVSSVEFIGESLPYVDGAEDELGSILAEAADRSSLSDVLASRIHDWPTMYHLSRQRSNLLRPLSLPPRIRVLDVGAGTGAITRYLGEQGAEVVALEGTPSRARAVATRCQDLPNVRVVCGAVGDLSDEPPFDLVVVIGVLEYAGHEFGGGLGPEAFLASIRRLVAPGGALALAIENQLGLKYLLGYAEDHLGAPWPGIEGYPGSSGIRTYARRSLGRLLEDAGLPPRRWLYPFPDYKLPRVVLSSACFSEPDAGFLVDQLVRTPVVDHANPRERFCDDRAALETLVTAGLGEDVANSFLVLAGDERAVNGLVDDDILAWHFGSERMSTWLRTKVFARRQGARVVETVPLLEASRRQGWLSQSIVRSEPFVTGPTLERLVLDAVTRHDTGAAGEVLGTWRDHVTAQATDVDCSAESLHPFRRASSRLLLPDDYLDVDLANFVRDSSGRLHYIDREWCAGGGVDLDLALTRALWALAHALIVSGIDMPWSPTTTVDELAVVLGSLCDFVIDDGLLGDWRDAEDALQELVTGADRETVARQRLSDRQLSRVSLYGGSSLPYTSLRRDVGRLQADTERLREETAAAMARADAAEGALESVHEELSRHRARAAQFEHRLLVRVYRRLLRRASPL